MGDGGVLQEKAAVSEDLDQFTEQYLKSRGYELSGTKVCGVGFSPKVLEDEASSFKDYLFMYAEDEAYFYNHCGEIYDKLRRWINNSISEYRIEMRLVLFPLFVHIYLTLVSRGSPEARKFIETYGPEHNMDYGDVYRRLLSITEPHHVKESPVAQMFIKKRYTINMLSYSFQLLLSFLHYNCMLHILHILNEHVNIKVTRERRYSQDVPGAPEPGAFEPNKAEVNSQEIDIEIPLDLELLNNAEAYIKEEKPEDQKVLFEEIKKLKSERKVIDYSNPKNQDERHVPCRALDIAPFIETLRSARNMIKLDSKTLPSICVYTFFNTYQTLNTLNISPNEEYISSGFSDSFVKVFNVKDQVKTQPKESFSQAEGAQAGSDEFVSEMFEEKTPSAPVKLIGHSGPVYSTSFSSDSKYLLSCSMDLTVRLWSMELMKNLAVYRGHNYPIWDVEFSPQFWNFATASYDQTARLWSCEYSKQLRIFAGHLSDVEVVKFHQSGNYLATGSSDRTAQFWDLNYGTRVRVFCYHKGPVQALAISPDGKHLATAGMDKTIALWDIGMGKCIKTFLGHNAPIHTLSFSQEGSILSSACSEGVICLWSVNDPQETCKTPLGAYPTKNTTVHALSFSKSNILLGAGSFYFPG